jgi:phosphoribosylanthranilate isomerase
MTLVKMCGMTRPDDAAFAASLGAAIGLVFWPESPRSVTEQQARAILDALPPLTMTVGVFVDQPATWIAELASRLELGAVQLHGDEEPDVLAAMPRRVLKAVTLDAVQQGRWTSLPAERVTLMLDAADPVRRGGTGQTLDWEGAAAVARTRRLILSGGLHDGNVGEAIRVVRPYGVDVSSGIESAPGVKDPARMRAFMRAVRDADERIGSAPDLVRGSATP